MNVISIMSHVCSYSFIKYGSYIISTKVAKIALKKISPTTLFPLNGGDFLSYNTFMTGTESKQRNILVSV